MFLVAVFSIQHPAIEFLRADLRAFKKSPDSCTRIYIQHDIGEVQAIQHSGREGCCPFVLSSDALDVIREAVGKVLQCAWERFFGWESTDIFEDEFKNMRGRGQAHVC